MHAVFGVVAVATLAVFLPGGASDGSLRFASYYRDHMVLQKAPARAVLWGFGPEGSHVSLSLSGPSNQEVPPILVTKGLWHVSLEPVAAGGPYVINLTLESSTLTLRDVLFGDIWLCGGQSNMLFSTSNIFNASEELALVSKYPHVRPFMVALELSEAELPDLINVQLPWSVPTVDVVSQFSAVCWLFGRYLYDVLKYPIGLVETCWGGTPVEAWSSRRVLKQCESEELKGPHNDSILWNAMIHPLLNMTIFGAIWYQGEANVGYREDMYKCTFPAMIDDWRWAFHQGSGGETALDFPFGFVQLSTNQRFDPSDGFPNIRWQQTAEVGYVPNQRMKKTFMAVALDLPDELSPFGTIHPRDKQDVALRLQLGARAVAYNQTKVNFLGPFPQKVVHFIQDVIIFYDQDISVTPSNDTFEVCCDSSCVSNSSWVSVPIVNWDFISIRLETPLCQRLTIRYAWRDWPCNFKACPVYGADKILPAPPFILH